MGKKPSARRPGRPRGSRNKLPTPPSELRSQFNDAIRIAAEHHTLQTSTSASTSVSRKLCVPGLAARLVTLREREGISARRLAEMAGVHIDTVKRAERAARGLSLQAAVKIARALGLTPNDLVPEITPNLPPA